MDSTPKIIKVLMYLIMSVCLKKNLSSSAVYFI